MTHSVGDEGGHRADRAAKNSPKTNRISGNENLKVVKSMQSVHTVWPSKHLFESKEPQFSNENFRGYFRYENQ